ncbi:phosphate/phosphite/phosphonate ABC transporter substrate-binding protein [Piscinibacter sp.]|uniref:phosphate/phosphite/phosphonate ABC transporter substrate-binding protein n=1 Tax=Piscinibacter sp. TaxID=1903157 RepID=UPI0039E39D75
MTRLAALLLGLLLGSAATAADREYTLAISEGTSGGLDHGRVIAKYGPLAEVIGRAVKRKVNVVFAREFAALEDGMRSGRFDLAMARPSDYPARAVRDHGYQYVATASPEGQCLILVPQASPLKTIADARGKRWVLPEKVSYMSRFCSAELRDQGIVIDKESVQFVREQGAVNFYLGNNFSDVGGVASYSGAAKSAEKSGLRILHRSVPQPYFPLVAGPKMTAEQVKAIQAELAVLGQSDAGRAVLSSIGIQGFDLGTGTRLQALLGWLGT